MTNLTELIRAVLEIVQILIPIVVGVALLTFLWGLANFIFKVGNSGEKAIEEGRNRMVWGLITLFVMLSVWGIITFFQRELGLAVTDYTGTPQENHQIFQNFDRAYLTPDGSFNGGNYSNGYQYPTPNFWSTLPESGARKWWGEVWGK
jgi:hypothetical protein